MLAMRKTAPEPPPLIDLIRMGGSPNGVPLNPCYTLGSGLQVTIALSPLAVSTTLRVSIHDCCPGRDCEGVRMAARDDGTGGLRKRQEAFPRLRCLDAINARRVHGVA